MSRIPLPGAIVEDRIVAIFRGADTATAIARVASLVEVGVQVIEITLDSPQALRTIDHMRDAYSEATVGAGTVMNAGAASRAVAAGAEFIVSPVVDPGVIAAGHDGGVATVPGAYTPTEIQGAWDMGASAVKLFPAGAAGAGYVRSILAVLAVDLIVTGGIDAANARGFLDAGAVAVGVGGGLTGGSAEVIAERGTLLRRAVSDEVPVAIDEHPV